MCGIESVAAFGTAGTILVGAGAAVETGSATAALAGAVASPEGAVAIGASTTPTQDSGGIRPLWTWALAARGRGMAVITPPATLATILYSGLLWRAFPGGGSPIGAEKK